MAGVHKGRLCGGINDAPPGRENDLEAIELDSPSPSATARPLVKVRTQVVAGTMHHFTVEVKEGGAKKLYEAQVWEKLWENFKQLHSFKPVDAETKAAA
ncbi:hypothetical protein PR202_gb01675 [Eleusine coracana subsp. coracana]|nr:hypothetical protein PR202_gb01675 [Eleusine coracana subsp. coracana]